MNINATGNNEKWNIKLAQLKKLYLMQSKNQNQAKYSPKTK